MIGRLAAALALLVSGLVLGSAAPASACSCVTDQVEQLVDNATVAFVGVLRSQRADDEDVVQRFTVDTVFRGDVHRTQDVVTPNGGGAGCGVEWETGARMVVLGYLDEGSRIAANVCTGSILLGASASADDPVLSTLGTGSDPRAGQDLVEINTWRSDSLLWIVVSVGVIGLTVLGLAVVVRRSRS